jgi:hypothetical protein
MSGFLGTTAELPQDITLLSQIAILLILIVGYKSVKDKKLQSHGLIMTAAVILHSLTIFLVMIPSFIIYFDVLLTSPFSTGILITWIHVIVGILAELLGVFLVLGWRFRPQLIKICIQRKRIMWPLLILWTLASILGIGFYVYFYL